MAFMATAAPYIAVAAMGLSTVAGMGAASAQHKAAEPMILAAKQDAAAAEYAAEVNAYNTLVDAENAALAAEARGEADEFNRDVALQEASSAKLKARADARDFLREQRARMATSRATQAASGFTFAGSPMLVDEAAFAEIELGAERLRHRGRVEATRLETRSSLLAKSARNERETAKRNREIGQQSAENARQAGRIGKASAGIREHAARVEQRGTGFSSLGSIGKGVTTLATSDIDFG